MLAGQRCCSACWQLQTGSSQAASLHGLRKLRRSRLCWCLKLRQMSWSQLLHKLVGLYQ